MLSQLAVQWVIAMYTPADGHGCAVAVTPRPCCGLVAIFVLGSQRGEVEGTMKEKSSLVLCNNAFSDLF